FLALSDGDASLSSTIHQARRTGRACARPMRIHLFRGGGPMLEDGGSAESSCGRVGTRRMCRATPSLDGAPGVPRTCPTTECVGASSTRCQRHRVGVGPRGCTQSSALVLSGLPQQARRGGGVVPGLAACPCLQAEGG